MTAHRILIFAPHFCPFGAENAEAIVNRKLAIAMLRAGWDVEIISRNVRYAGKPRNEPAWAEPWAVLEHRTHVLEYDNGMGKSLTGSLRLLSNAVRFGNLVPGMGIVDREIGVAEDLHTARPFDLIISRAIPESAHLPAMIFSKRTGLPWIANWNDPSKSRLPYPYVPLKESVFFRKYLRDVARGASFHTFPCERLRKYVAAYLGDDTAAKSMAVPHAAIDPGIASVEPRNDAFTLCYAGAFDKRIRSMDAFISGLKRFMEKRRGGTRIRFRIIGQASPDMIDDAVKPVSELLGPMSYGETLRRLSASDALLIIESPFREGIFLPSKLVDYVQTGRPILAVSPARGTVNDIISAHGGGIAAACDSPEDIAGALEKLYAHWEQGDLARLFSSGHLFGLFSPETVLSKYEEIFSLIGVRTP